MFDELAPEYGELRRNVRRFNEEVLDPVGPAADEQGKFPLEVFRQAAKLGYVGAHLPEEYGGAGDLVAKAVIYEENCRINLGYNVSVNASDLLFANHVAKFGTPEQKRRYLPPIIAGDKIGCWALTEPNSGSDALSITTRWEPAGDGFVLNGQKTFITNAPIADFFIVIARKPGSKGLEGGTTFILERGLPGLSTGEPMKKMGCMASPTGEVVLEDVKVGREQVLGEVGAGLRQMLKSLDVERCLSPFSSIGVSMACLEHSVRYAHERSQFGKPIASYQLIQQKIAEMAMNLEIIRAYCYQLLEMVKQGKSVTRQAAMAKLFASRMVTKTTNEALQIFGGYGYMKEYPIEHHLRDARLLEIGAGTSEIQTLVIAREVYKELGFSRK
jgi:alkylation response protein AidB-like acyl-CoA dehydrogenase